MFNRTRMMQAAGAGGVVEIALTISSDTHNYNIWDNRGSDYDAGNSIITLTINSGIYVGSTSTGAYSLTIPSNFDASDEIIIINNGFIVGMGGAGGTGANGTGSNSNGSAGGSGGSAISASRAVSITNNGTVAGGGGGGGGTARRTVCLSSGYCGCAQYGIYRGNGGGGGAGYNGGSAGSHGFAHHGGGASGSAGSKTGGGAGGSNSNMTSPGGSGGGLGGAGSTGASYGSGSGGAGGGAGNYAVGNSNITWATTGTRLGGVS